MGFFYTERETVPGLSVTKKRFTALPSGLVLTLSLCGCSPFHLP